jgi:hypothetical protein
VLAEVSAVHIAEALPLLFGRFVLLLILLLIEHCRAHRCVAMRLLDRNLQQTGLEAILLVLTIQHIRATINYCSC